MKLTSEESLRSAVEHLYRVFARYPFPVKSEYCKHCVRAEEQSALRSKPLRELNAKDLSRYSFKALSTWGTVEQFKHLLPRLFELVITDEYRECLEILFGKPRFGGLSTWPGDEQAALNVYCGALWRHALARYPIGEALASFPSIDECLCSIAQIIDDLSPFLEAWDSDRGQAATRHLVDFAVENASYLRENRRLSNNFWDERRTQMQQVVDWFLARDFSLVFDVVDAATTAEEFREELSRAIMRRDSTQPTS